MASQLQRVRVPHTYPRERIVLGELHLLRSRLDGLLSDLAVLAADADAESDWLKVEEASRLARRALLAGLAVAPPAPIAEPDGPQLQIGALRIDPSAGRQWYGEVEVELSPLRHRLLAVMASEPYRVFAKDELLREVWRRPPGERTNSVNTSIGRIRRALVRAGAPSDTFMLSLHGVGWALTRPPGAR